MSSQKKMWWLRLIEKSLLFLLLFFASLRMVLLFIDPATETPLVWWYVLSIALVLLAFLFFIQDKIDSLINEVIEIANRDTNQKFISLYERSPTPYITVNSVGNIVAYNPAAVHLLDTTLEKIKEINFYELLFDHAKQDISVLSSKIKAGLVMIDEEVAIHTGAGEQKWVLMSVYIDDFNDQRIVSLVDITQPKKIDAAKSEFVALATHQLRTPIAAVRWNAELLRKNLGDNATFDQSRYVAKIERNVLKMISLINDFLSVSKLEMGTYASAIEVINVTDFLNTVTEEFAEKIGQKNINLERNDSPPGCTIRTDSRLFHIIVSNLVSNAVKYIGQEGTLRLSYQVAESNLILEIADNGIGIPRSEIEKLFTKFYRASNAQAHQTEGTGLGLYIVKQSVEQLGGTITVQSDENQGARFIVTLPLST